MEKPVNIAAPVFVIVVLILLDLSSAAEYKVGDSFGWSYDGNLETWADSRTFHVGDVLVFEYSPEYHNVMEVDETGYNRCKSSSHKRIYESGNDRITLRSKGTKYYICEHHCNFANQKLMIMSTDPIKGGKVTLCYTSSLNRELFSPTILLLCKNVAVFM